MTSATKMSAASTGAQLIAAERNRQIDVEGYQPEHDRSHFGGVLVDAALCYATPAPHRFPDARGIPLRWPWKAHYWKPTPTDRVRELVKAGALIAAEIDRLQSVTS